MILVTLGTQDKDFSRLLKAIDTQIKKGNIKEKVIVQSGYTKYKSNNMEIFDLIEPKKLHELVKKCNILITHGGVGSILDGIQNNKVVIAAARLKKYNEHTNDHQTQIIKEFKKQGYILELTDFSKLDIILNQAKTFKPKKYKSNSTKFTKNITDYIENDNHISWFNKYINLSSYGYRGIFLSIINGLIFWLFLNKLNVLTNIILSYIITLLINIIINYLVGINYKNTKKFFIIIQCINLIIDLVFMTFINNLYTNLIGLKLMVNVGIIILNYLVIKFVFMRRLISEKK